MRIINFRFEYLVRNRIYVRLQDFLNYNNGRMHCIFIALPRTKLILTNVNE